MRILIFTILCLSAGAGALGQAGIVIRRSSAPIVLDGVLNDADWQTTEVASDFHQYFPYDSSLANAQTEIRLAYDDQFIYVGAKMYNHGSGPRKYVTPSLRRDYRGEANDGVSIVLDTFKDRTNAFVFGVNPFGVQREG